LLTGVIHEVEVATTKVKKIQKSRKRKNEVLAPRQNPDQEEVDQSSKKKIKTKKDAVKRVEVNGEIENEKSAPLSDVEEELPKIPTVSTSKTLAKFNKFVSGMQGKGLNRLNASSQR
jgi:hypothetical protein